MGQQGTFLNHMRLKRFTDPMQFLTSLAQGLKIDFNARGSEIAAAVVQLDKVAVVSDMNKRVIDICLAPAEKKCNILEV